MKRFRTPHAWAIAALCVLGLSACETPDLFSDPVVLQCPDYFILEDAASITVYRPGDGRDLTDVTARAEMGRVELACLSLIDNKTDSGTLEVDVVPVVAVEMGPANESQTASLPYFVVVTNPDKEILYREELSVNVSFAGNRSRLIARGKPTTLEIPITPEIRERYYLIYSGFVLTRDQVDYNRRAIQNRLQ